MNRAMKESGIPWIGKIPSHWRVEQIGSCIKEVNCPNTNNTEDNALQFKMGTIISKKGGDSKYNPESLEAYNKVRQGDIIINGLNLSFDFISQRVGLVREDGVITSTYLALHPLPLIDSRYLTYLFKGYDYCKALHSMGRGLRATLGYKEFRKYSVIFPSLKEQQSIADFLDKKCGEIDEMVSLQERIVEELKAYKQSVITEAVCKGLNPDAPMKDSGIEWIGQIPEGWNIQPIKWGFDIIAGATPKSDNPDYWGGPIPWITPADYKTEDRYIKEGSRFLTEAGMASCSTTLLPTNSVIFSKRAPIGLVVVNQEPICTNQGCFGCVSHGDCSSYYYYAMSAFTEQYGLYGSGTTFKEISASLFADFPLPHPPVIEQQAIADYLDTKCAEINTLISLKQSKIESLKEYKKSIIYEYITGKKEIPYGD